MLTACLVELLTDNDNLPSAVGLELTIKYLTISSDYKSKYAI